MKIFVSQCSRDKTEFDRVYPIVRTLESAGHEVFVDDHIEPSITWLSVLEARLNGADVVLVIWTPDSMSSRWVAEEALAGLKQNKLLSIVFDGASPPFGFQTVECISLASADLRIESPQLLFLQSQVARFHNRLSSASKDFDFSIYSDGELLENEDIARHLIKCISLSQLRTASDSGDLVAQIAYSDLLRLEIVRPRPNEGCWTLLQNAHRAGFVSATVRLARMSARYSHKEAFEYFLAAAQRGYPKFFIDAAYHCFDSDIGSYSYAARRALLKQAEAAPDVEVSRKAREHLDLLKRRYYGPLRHFVKD